MNIFLDLGTHKGEGLLEFFDYNIIDDTYEVHTFEASPSLDTVNEINNKIKDIKNFPKKINFYNKAIWVEDGYLDFNDRKDMASHIESTGFKYFQEKDQFNSIKVECINFVNFVNSLPKESYIVCKMDIEGSEFQVLRHLISTESIKKINKIYVEFHPYSNGGLNGTYGENNLTMLKIIEDIRSFGTEFYLWK
jgi:FkbM family methyltransferase